MPVQVTGPDGLQYQFPDGTDKAAAVGYFKKKGIGAQAPFAPKAQFTAGGPRPLAAKLSNARDYVVNALPSIGGTAGGLLGAAAGEGLASVPFAVAGSAAGGVIGEEARQKLNQHFHPEEKPMSREDATREVGKQGVEQGLAELVGGGLGAALGPTMKGAVSKLYFAGNLGPREDLELVMPEILEAEKKQPAKTVGDFIDVVGSAKKKIGIEVDTAMLHKVPVSEDIVIEGPSVTNDIGIKEPLSVKLKASGGGEFALKRKFGRTYEAISPDGTVMGTFGYTKYPDGTFAVTGAGVKPEFQRRGIANAAYDAIEKITGKPLRPAGSQTDAGRSFWASRAARGGRPSKKMVSLAEAPADTTPVASRILQLTTNHPSEAVTDPAKINRIRQRVIKNYSQPRSYGWLNDRRTVLNRELNKYYALKTPADKAQYLFNHPDFEIDKAEADAIRDVVYPSMDRAAGKPPGYFEALQRKRGALMSIEDQAEDHIQNLKMKSKHAKGAPINDPAHAYIGDSGHIGIYTRLTHLKAPDVAKRADKQVSRAFGHTPGSKAAKAAGSPIGRQVLALPLRYIFNPDMPDPNEKNATDAWAEQ